METFTLKLSCKDKRGIISAITGFILEHNGNILNLDQHSDNDKKLFFMRIEWEKQGFAIDENDLETRLGYFLKYKNINGEFELYFSNTGLRMCIFVSRYNHCLYDLLIRHQEGEIKCDIPLIISNHEDLKKIADYFNIDFYCIPINKKTKKQAEEEELALLSQYKINFIVLARYMQIITDRLIKEFSNKIINIHHSFLPAFKGAKPYHQAFDKGVKIIGATSHFVTAELDQGPIIHQDVIRISHKDNINSMIIKGRDIEKQVLAEAVKLYIDNRIFVSGNKTIIL